MFLLTAAAVAAVSAFAHLMATEVPRIDTGPLSSYQPSQNNEPIADPPHRIEGTSSVLTQEQVAGLYEELKALPREQANSIVETLDDGTYQQLRKLRDVDTILTKGLDANKNHQIQSSAPATTETLSEKLKRLDSIEPEPADMVAGSNYLPAGGTPGKQLKYNALENRWEYAGSGDNVRYNPLEDRWQYAGKDENIRYNTFQDRWDFAKKSDSLQYNPFEDNWEYGSKNSNIKYNSLEDQWQRTEPGETLRYNAFENRWSYE